MHNLAMALHDKGDHVTGSDDEIFEPSRGRLAARNLLPDQEGWNADRITPDIDSVILGMHAKGDNPELLRAQELGLSIYSYPEYLYERSKDKTRVVIAGSHGKTTITSMILHVLHYHDRDVDYMVGAQLEGFDCMVRLTDHNEFMLLEGDEYLSSSLDPRPKIHLYHPNIALISGIAWDHVNVFPTLENYVEQFEIFVNQISPGGILVYNEEDAAVKKIAEDVQIPMRKHAYGTPQYSIHDGQVYLDTPEGEMPLEIFGAHNMNNLEGARWICQHMGVDQDGFYEAIASFKGASKRLETVAKTEQAVVYKDFAHAPSKVTATTKALKEQYPDRTVIACLELHTYSSLNPEFIHNYAGALDAADVAAVCYSDHALKIKGLPALDAGQVKDALQRKDIQVFDNPADFQAWLREQDLTAAAVVLMSSGTFGNLDYHSLQSLIEQ